MRRLSLVLVLVALLSVGCSNASETSTESTDGIDKEIELTSSTGEETPGKLPPTTPRPTTRAVPAPTTAPATSVVEPDSIEPPPYRPATAEDDLFCSSFKTIVLGETPHEEVVASLELLKTNTPPELSTQIELVTESMRQASAAVLDGQLVVDNLGDEGLALVETMGLMIQGQPGGNPQIRDVFQWAEMFCYDQLDEAAPDLFVTARSIPDDSASQESPFSSTIGENIYREDRLCFRRGTEARTTAAALFADSKIQTLSDATGHWELTLEPRSVGTAGNNFFEISCSITGTFD